MRISGHSNGIAIALAGLAVVMAATGTAYAVTATTVHIADGTSPSRVAHVDYSGHLLTAGAAATIDSVGYMFGFNENNYTYVTSPTTATLALTRIRIENPTLNDAGNKQQISLVKVGVNSAGACDENPGKNYGFYTLAAGQESDDVLTPPLLVTPTAGAKYCLALFATLVNSPPRYYNTYSITAYVTAGSYKGIGVGPDVARIGRSAKIAK